MEEISLSKAEAFNCIAFCLNNQLRNENGSLIEFKDHAFLIDPYLDNAEKLVAMKCAQIGFSTLAIIRSFHLARFAGANIIHTFPSRNMAKDFVLPKVDPLIIGNPVIKKMVGVDSMSLKQIGGRFIYYRGSYEQTEAISISAHILMNDEYDRSNQRVLKAYRSRLDDAKRERPELGWEWRFSNPSIPGAGVDELWQKSDQKHWFVKCRHCGNDWYLKFPDNIDFNRKVRICEKCHYQLKPEDLINGRWVKKKLGLDVSGYWFSQMMVPWIQASKIIEDSEGDPEVFHNFTLGLPYVSKDRSLNREAIIKCLDPGYNPRTNVAIGVDNGRFKTYVVGNRYGIFEVGQTESWDDIENLRNRYGAIMVIDALPYPTTPNRLALKYRGKVFVHYYQIDKKSTEIFQYDDERPMVRSDRTKIIDAVVADINAGDVTFNLSLTEMEQYIYQCEQVYRVVEDTPQGIKKSRWKTIEGRPDHYLHATVFWRLALEKTLSHGGIVTPRRVLRSNRSFEVSPDNTVPALDLDKAVSRAMKHRRTNNE